MALAAPSAGLDPSTTGTTIDTATARVAPAQRPRSILGYVAMPIFLGLVLLALYVWVSNTELDSIEARRINREFIFTALLEHLRLTAASTALVVAIAVPLGIMLTRPFARWITPGLLGVANIGQAVPSIGILVLLALVWAFGFVPSIVALVAYSLLPVLRNTMVGLQQVDRALIEAGTGMGMSKAAVLGRVELPLAVPVILAGVRTALVINVGSATLATFVNGGGLGDIIANGISQSRQPVIIVGSVLTAVLALFIDWLGGLVEGVLRPKGL